MNVYAKSHRAQDLGQVHLVDAFDDKKAILGCSVD